MEKRAEKAPRQTKQDRKDAVPGCLRNEKRQKVIYKKNKKVTGDGQQMTGFTV